MPHKILLVDDDKEFRDEFKACFNEYDIVDVPNGTDAVALLKKPNDIALVILDVNMPEPRGTEVLAAIKSITPDLCVIILTGHSSEAIAVSSLKGHADDYIEKPFDIDTMRDAIERLLDKNCVQAGDDGGDKIKRVQAFINRNCYKKVSLTDAANSVGLSAKYLSRAFKDAAGIGFNEYRIKIQIERARELLTRGLHNVSEISERLGYKNTESFIRQFKKIMKQTPTEYRGRHKREENRGK